MILLNTYLSLHIHSVILKNLTWYLVNDVLEKNAATTIENNYKLFLN